MAQRITNQQDLIQLGIKGLHLPIHVVDAVVHVRCDDIRVAAHEVLKKWLLQQTDSTSAYANLAIALQECGMYNLAAELKSYGKPAVESVPLVKSMCNGCTLITILLIKYLSFSAHN